MNNFKKMNLKPIIKIIFVVTALLWVVFVILSDHIATYEGPIYDYVVKPFLIGMTLLPLLSGVFAIRRSLRWGGWKSKLGKSLMSIGFGFFGWAGGMIFWNYYLFFMNIEVPYPSLGDLFYILIWPFWTYAMICLFKVSGAKYGLKKTNGKTLALVLSTAVVLISYYFLFLVARQGQIELGYGVFSDLLAFLYPLGDLSVLLSSVLVFSLSFGFLGGIYRKAILILILGFTLNYIADVIFVFTATTGSYFNAHLVDLLYVVMLFTVFLGVSKLNPDALNNKNQNQDS